MKVKKIRIPVPVSLFEWGILFLLLKVMCDASGILPYGDTADTFLSVIACVLLTFSVLFKRVSLAELLVYGVVLISALLTSISTGSMFIFLTVISCLSARRQNLDRFLYVVFVYELIFFVFHTLLSIMLIPFGYNMIQEFNGSERFYFGFVHPNTFSIILLNLTVLWVWRKYHALKKEHLAVILAVHVVFYCFTLCRSALYAVLVLVILICVFYGKEKRRKILALLAKYSVPVLGALIFMLVSQYTSDHWLIKAVDSILSGRIKLGAYAYETYGVTLLGQNLSSIVVVWDDYWKLSGHTFDCVYSYMLINYGIVWLIMIVVLFYNCAKKGNEKVNIMLILWACYGIAEVHPLNPFLFFPLFLITNRSISGGDTGIIKMKKFRIKIR